jgi:hypothetical protein
MPRPRARFDAVIALSLAVQAVLGALWWWRPAALPGTSALALWLFPGVALAWAAIHTSLPVVGAVIVGLNLAYHVAIAGLLAAAWRRLRPPV